MFKRHLFHSSARQWLVLGLLLSLGTALRAAAPAWETQLNYQGQLTDSTGVPEPDGPYSIQFLIYDSSAGGTLLWSETQASVNVSKGLFNVILGSVTPINLPNYRNDTWLAVKVGADAEMTPRQQLLPSVYSYNAKRLDGNLIGAGPSNIPQLDALGKLPSSMIAGGSLSVPMDMTGSGGPYNLRVNDTSPGGYGIVADSASSIAVSATTAATTGPAIYGEGARYGMIVKTDDGAAGIALQAIGQGSTYANLIDRVNLAGVYGQSLLSGTYGVLGQNTTSGPAVGGYSVSGIGVSGTGGSYGVYGQSGNTGVYGTGSSIGVYGYSAGNYGVRADSGYMGLYATGTTYGTYSNSPNYGVYAVSTGSVGRGLWAQHQGAGAGYGVYAETSSSAANAKGVYGVATSAAAGGTTYGVYGQTNSPAANSAGVLGLANATSGATVAVYGVNNSAGSGAVGVWGQVLSPTANLSYGLRGDTWSSIGFGVAGFSNAASGSSTAGVFGGTNSTTGIGVMGNGFIGVRGTSNLPNGDGVVGSSGDVAGEGVYAENNNAGAGATAAAVSSTASGSGVGLRALGGNSGYGVSASAGIGLAGFSNGGNNWGVFGQGGTAGIEGSSTLWGVEGISTYGGVIGRGVNSGSGTNYGVLATADGSGGAAGYFYANSTGVDGIQAYSTGAGMAAGKFSHTGGSGTTYGVNSTASSPAGFAGYFVNTAASSPSEGIYGEGYAVGVSASARYSFGDAFRGHAYYPFHAVANSGGTNFYSDTAGNPSYGFYHYASPALNGSLGIYVVNQTTTGGGAFIYNESPLAGNSGYALSVQGKIRVPDCSGKVTFNTVPPWTVNSAVVGSSAANCIDSNSNILVTLVTPLADPIYVTSVVNGAFTVSTALSATNPVTFYYWVVGE